MFGFTGKSGAIKNLAVVIHNGFFILCAAVGAVLYSSLNGATEHHEYWTELAASNGVSGLISNLFFNSDAGFFIGIILFILGSVGIYIDQNRLDEKNRTLEKTVAYNDHLRNALNSAQEVLLQKTGLVSKLQKKIVGNWLKGCCKDNNLTSKDRVSIYFHNGKHFTILARHSINPALKKTHRDQFSDTEGVISKAWQHGSHTEESLPEYTAEKERAYKVLVKRRYRLDSEKIDKLNMKSCSYFAKSITDADDPIGVIVFESVNPNFISATMKDSIESYCTTYYSQLASFVRDAIQTRPEAELKMEKGSTAADDEMKEIMGGGK